MSHSMWSQFICSWRQELPMQMATLSVLAGTFLVLAFALMLQQNLQHILVQWGNNVKVNVYLQEETSDQEVSKISEFIEKSKMFDQVNFISKDQAVIKFKERVGSYAPGFLTDLEFDSPLPASFELSMQGGVRSGWDYNAVVKFAEEVKKLMGVEEVSYGQGWVENYAAVLKALTLISWIFLAILLLGSIFVVGNSIRNSVHQRRDEIEILELFGANRAMIVWPYVFEGIMLGLMASVSAVGISYLLYLWQMSLITESISFWGFISKIQFLSAPRIISIIALGTFIGGMGAFIWARQLSSGWAAAEAAHK